MATFSWLTICLMALGLVSHWLMLVRKARATARATGTSLPDLVDYWTADWPTTGLSVIGVVVIYFVLPSVATHWPEMAVILGTTEADPLNPLAAYMAGLCGPFLADAAGRRMAAMVGDAP